jgi:hypothetical protein
MHLHTSSQPNSWKSQSRSEIFSIRTLPIAAKTRRHRESLAGADKACARALH